MNATSRRAAPAAAIRRHHLADLIAIAGAGLLAVWAASAAFPGRAHAQASAAPPSQATIFARTETPPLSQTPVALPSKALLKLADTLSSPDAKIRALGYDPVNLRTAIAAYKTGHFDAGDAALAQIKDPVMRTAVQWVALRNQAPTAGLDRLETFANAHPDWMAGDWLRREIEGRLPRVHDPIKVLAFFVPRAPETVAGKLALAKALAATGRGADGTKLARAVFRETDMPPSLDGWFVAEFGDQLTRGDYAYRADRRLYKGYVTAALRDASRAGSDVLAVAKARASLMAPRAGLAAADAVPEALRADPGLILAEAHRLRHAGRLIEAARLMRKTAGEEVADSEEWWTERRVLARELLDAGKPNAAYITCALHAHGSRESDLEAEFHAGWIALRFMHDPERASYHFGTAAKLAQSPTTIARIAYWQGRTAETSGDIRTRAFYERAAAYSATYYGQLAREKLGRPIGIVRQPTVAAAGLARAEEIRVIELLYAADEKGSAAALAVAATKRIADPPQVAALASVISGQEDAHLSLIIGKLLAQRGIAVDTLAFPTFGVPAFKELANSATLPVVYSVARQESAFISQAVSSARANGLMQMIDATALATARKAGLPFSHSRLLHDPAYNAQLGAAHLGTLMSEHDGSLVLTFAAYNAGGGRVKQWLREYGDPRKPGVDPIDWVERIPFSETRDYVQRVMENVGMYNALFAEKARGDAVARDGSQAGL